MATASKTPAKKTTKTVAPKAAAVKKAVTKAPAKEKLPVTVKAHGMVVEVLGLDGKKTGETSLPESVFGVKVNEQLIAQAVRVYLANQREGSAMAKTRGEVEGSTRKIYKQKGTGRARHGAIRAPIFVGGGIVFGPRPHSFRLDLPVGMKRGAFASALSAQFAAGAVRVVSGFAGMEPKTKLAAEALDAVKAARPTLLVVASMDDAVVRAARNLEGVDVMPVSTINTYSIVTHKTVVFETEAIERLAK